MGLGANLVTNGGFTGNSNGWGGSGLVYNDNNMAAYTRISGLPTVLYESGAIFNTAAIYFNSGSTIQISIDLSIIEDVADFYFQLYNGDLEVATEKFPLTDGMNIQNIPLDTDYYQIIIGFENGDTSEGYEDVIVALIDNVSVREVLGGLSANMIDQLYLEEK